MLGVIYSATSDFSVFSYPRSPASSGLCYETHSTPIEERYCTKEHVHYCDDEEWEELLARGIQLFDESEPDALCVSELCSNYSEVAEEEGKEEVEAKEEGSEGEWSLVVPPTTPVSAVSISSTPSLIGGGGAEDAISSVGGDSEDDSEYEDGKVGKSDFSYTVTSSSDASNKRKRKRGKANKAPNPRKRLCRASSVSTLSSVTSANSSLSSTSLLLSSMLNTENPWKCPHCSWIQHTQRLPDFLRHQRSHFVSQSDWPCPNPTCGKGFARKDSLKRHLDNRSTGCKRPPGYTVC